jgi:hypothetical protein
MSTIEKSVDELAKEWVMDENPTVDTAELWFYLQMKSFKAGYKAAEIEIEKLKEEKQELVNKVIDSRLHVLRVQKEEIEKLKKQLDIAKEYLETAYLKACSCCNSSEDVKKHCDKAFKQIESADGEK